MTDDAVYRMSQTTPPVVGHDGLVGQMQTWVDSSESIEFKILETLAKGPIVLNHRINHFASKTRPVKWEGVGVFYVEGGKIKEWSDYTIRVERG
jgi:limonene-1,2-epoxide hydrolase